MNRCALAILATAMAFGLPASGIAAPKNLVSLTSVQEKLHPGLPEAIRAAKPSDRISVTFTMALQASRDQVDRASRPNDPDVRRASVVGLLKGVAAEGQRGLLAALKAGQRDGAVGKVEPLWILSMVVAEVKPAMILSLARRSDVALVSYNRKVNAMIPVIEGERYEGGDVFMQAPTWGLNMIQAPRVWSELNIIGRGVVISDLDTGSCLTHPDSRNRLWTNPDEIPNNGIDDDGNGKIDDIVGWNFGNNTNNPSDSNGHGTHTGGTIVGDGTQGTQTGVAPGANMIVCNVRLNLTDEALCWAAIQYSTAEGARAWNASFGWLREWNPNRRNWRDVVLNSMAAGMTALIAAGNEGNSRPPYSSVRCPGDIPEVITLGATNSGDTIASFSSNGPVEWANVQGYNDFPYPPGKMKPTVSAPGDNVTSLSSSGCTGYRALSGTSMATPHACGTTALMYEANPWLRPEQVKEILMATSVDKGAPGRDNIYGVGRIDAYRAVLEAQNQRTRHYAETYQIVKGQRLTRDRMGDMYIDDNVYMAIQARTPFAVADPSVQVVFTTTSRLANPAAVGFFVQMNASAGPAIQSVELWDYDANGWVEIDSRAATVTDQDAFGESTVNPGRFVDNASNQVRARVNVFDRGIPFLNWNGRLDFLYFNIR